MLCQRCKKNAATVFYRENVNGKVKNFALCADCANDLESEGELSLKSPFDEDSFTSPLKNMISDFDNLFSGLFTPAALENHTEKRCPLCGASFGEIAESGKVGCAQCYKTFSKELESSLRQIHGNVTHLGPAHKSSFAGVSGSSETTGGDPAVKKAAETEALKAELESAVKDERFEDAAVLRDRIKKLDDAAEKEKDGD